MLKIVFSPFTTERYKPSTTSGLVSAAWASREIASGSSFLAREIKRRISPSERGGGSAFPPPPVPLMAIHGTAASSGGKDLTGKNRRPPSAAGSAPQGKGDRKRTRLNS